MTKTATHYELLGVSPTSSEREIKRAFYGLLKEYPPEQKPKEYQRLREAYDVLSNPVSRSEYDNMASFGAEIEALKAEAEQILQADTPDFSAGIRTLKKAVVLGPDIGLLRNMLGSCYLGKDEAQFALNQFLRERTICNIINTDSRFLQICLREFCVNGFTPNLFIPCFISKHIAKYKMTDDHNHTKLQNYNRMIVQYMRKAGRYRVWRRYRDKI